MKFYMVMASLAPSMSFAFWGPALPFAPHSKQQQQQQCGQHLSATTSTRALIPEPLWMAKGKGGGNDKKKAPQEMQIRHWDEDDETEFLLIADSKNQATINCTAETLVTRGGKEYMIGLPIDTPVVVVDEKMNALELGFDARLPEMLPTVEATLTDMGATLLRSAGTLTIEGDVEIYDEEGEFGGEGRRGG
ncbi:hypothetical protein Naga_100377g1, partial [Nannochloropsis gaditana]